MVAETSATPATVALTVTPTLVTVTFVPSTLTPAALATEVPVPENGHVTAALITPVRSSGRPRRSMDALATWLEADVDKGPRVALLVITPRETPAGGAAIELSTTVPFVAGALTTGLRRS